MRYPTTLVALLSLSTVAPAHADPLSRRVIDAPDGHVRFSMTARPNVCGYEDAIVLRPEPGTSDAARTFHGASVDLAEAQAKCVEGPVRVELTVRGNRVQQVSTRVGAEFEDVPGRVTDLGAVSAEEGVEYLLSLAPVVGAAHGDDPIIAVGLADGVDPSADLIALAANRRAMKPVRMTAISWAAESGASADQLRALYDRVREPDLREQILFGFSRMSDDASTRELIRVARSDDADRLRSRAVYWLGQRAGESIAGKLGDIVTAMNADRQAREEEIFQISRRPRDQAVPSLIEIARTSPDPRLRERAVFWLGQLGDPRAVDLFESILTAG
jgi:HEAT repeat protein